MNFNQRLKELRIDHDKNQTEIAQIIGVRQNYYSQQESGKKPFRVEQIIKLCKYYQVSADYILGLPPGLNWPREEKKSRG